MNSRLSTLQRLKPRALLSLVIIYVATLMSWYWLWGVLFLFWAAVDLYSGSTWLSENVVRTSHALLFYVIVATWLLFGFYFVFSPFAYLLNS
ncbi:MAG: hypothetical protein AAF420_03580 [Pseudomonadota bacterium]